MEDNSSRLFEKQPQESEYLCIHGLNALKFKKIV